MVIASCCAAKLVAFLRWWGEKGPAPYHIEGMKFDATAKSVCALAVLGHAVPGNTITAEDSTWRKHVATLPHAARVLLDRLRGAAS